MRESVIIEFQQLRVFQLLACLKNCKTRWLTGSYGFPHSSRNSSDVRADFFVPPNVPPYLSYKDYVQILVCILSLSSQPYNCHFSACIEVDEFRQENTQKEEVPSSNGIINVRNKEVASSLSSLETLGNLFVPMYRVRKWLTSGIPSAISVGTYSCLKYTRVREGSC